MEEKKEYLSEEEYQRNNERLKSIGKILLIAGVIVLVVSFIFLILGFLNLGNSAVSSFNNGAINEQVAQKTAGGILGSFGLFALGGIANTIGLIIASAGGIILIIAHRRTIISYTTQQVMPVAQEGIEKMAPTVGNAVEKVAEGITKGVKKGLKDDSKE